MLRVEQGREETPRGETPRGETPRGETLRGETPRGERPRGQTPQRETPHVRVTTLMEKASRISGRVSSIGGCRTSLERYASEDTVDGRAKVTEQYERIATSSQHGLVVKIEHFARRCLPCPAFERFINGPVFQFGACSMIVLNACYIAYEVDFSVKEAFHDFDMRAPGTTSEVAFENLWPLEVFFAVFFFLELLARLMANQGLFCKVPHRFSSEWCLQLSLAIRTFHDASTCTSSFAPFWTIWISAQTRALDVRHVKVTAQKLHWSEPEPICLVLKCVDISHRPHAKEAVTIGSSLWKFRYFGSISPTSACTRGALWCSSSLGEAPEHVVASSYLDPNGALWLGPLWTPLQLLLELW